jgi:uncharacterized protein YndB with AHSA1/START domain
VADIRIVRTYRAPREAVWSAWLEPEQLTRWWGKRGWTAPVDRITVDPRPGGVFRLTGVNDADGSEMTTDAVLLDIVRPELLVIEEPARGATSTVTFTDLGDGRTEVRLHAALHASPQLLSAAEAGLRSALDRLADHLEEP